MSDSCSVLSNSLQSMNCHPPGSFVHGILQARILEWVAFPFSRGSYKPRLNPGLPHCRWILYHLSFQGSPRILEWVAYPFSSGSFRPRNRTGVSCIAGGFFTKWAIREAQVIQSCLTLWPHGLYSSWNSPGQNTGVGSLSLLQGVFPNQGSNQGLLYSRWILYQVSYQRSSSDVSTYCYLLKCKFSKGRDFALSAAVCPALRIVLSYSRCQINICWMN